MLSKKKLALANKILKAVDPTVQRIEPYQRDFLVSGESDIRGRLIVKSRRLGISTIIAIEAAIDVLTKPRWEVLFISKSREDAQDLLERARDAIKVVCQLTKGEDWEEHFKKLLPERDSLSYIKLSNGSTLRSVAASEDSARGKTANRLYLDEFAAIYPPDVADEIWRSALPTLATTGGMVTVVSTPKGKDNRFAKLWFDEKFPCERFHLPYTVCDRLVAIEDQLRAQFTEIEFEQEFNCSFDVLEGGLWTWAELNSLEIPRVDDRDISRGHNILAWDPASVNDLSAVLVINVDGRAKKVIHLEDISSLDWADQAQRVLALEEIYRPIKVVVDASGVGRVAVDLLKPIAGKIVQVHISKDLRAEMMLSIKSEAESKRFHICKSKWAETLKRDLFSFDMQKKAFPEIRSKVYGHHDFGDALILGWVEVKKLRRTIGIWTPNRPIRELSVQEHNYGSYNDGIRGPF
jgi:phage FluMu gp28-like protein